MKEKERIEKCLQKERKGGKNERKKERRKERKEKRKKERRKERKEERTDSMHGRKSLGMQKPQESMACDITLPRPICQNKFPSKFDAEV